MLQGLISDRIYIHDVLGTGEMVPLSSISEVELTTETDKDDKELANRYLSGAPISGSLKFTPSSRRKFDAFAYFAWTGNDLYLRFPKKMKRSRGITRFKNRAVAMRRYMGLRRIKNEILDIEQEDEL